MSPSQSPATPLRVGVVGLGVMGKNHARVLHELPGVTLVGVADPDQAQVDFVTSRLCCAGFSSLEALLDAGIDALTVAAPTQLHTAISLAAIARGVHVLVEKPIAHTVEEGRKIIDAAEKAGVTLMVGHVERFKPGGPVDPPGNRRRRHPLDPDHPRRPLPAAHVRHRRRHRPRRPRHRPDPLVHRLGDREIQPQTNSIHAAREDIALLQFRTESGVLAHINTNWLTPFKARTVHVATRNKYISGDLITRQVTECFDYKPDGSYSMRHLSVAYAEPLRAELVAFIDSVRNRTAPVTGGADGLASLDIAMRCLADRQQPANPPLRVAAGRRA